MAALAGKIAIVTGAGGGFGEGIARAYVDAGARVIVADIKADAAQRVAQELGAAASAFTVDVTNRAQVEALVRHCVDTFGSPHIVVNNAGTTHKNRPMLEVDEATFDRVFAVNVKS
ncbi:MAG: SDR family NAD(P)-dependent oxidoreductase, partial [Betaproteobacteria bacterium]|nr:SDR family NAD(P)-dependent oxidoreductase [Betaproteobacteria bacterium]